MISGANADMVETTGFTRSNRALARRSMRKTREWTR
jgi:hypothetical protein